ncbi:MAG: sulfur reduction protein DsrS [Bdellovibrio bacteriovorus]
MELSREDAFRLNVLLANKPLAIRVDEGKLEVHGLAALPDGTQPGEGSREVRVQLHPTTRPEHYLRLVRELISGQVLGSPGGYPVYLKRWTRMGQMRDESLAQLLLLGEPEAVVAAVCSPGLTDELARRAWWAMEDAENARRMLGNPAIVRGAMGPVLAAYLVDYLPFETESERIVESVRLVLQPGLISPEQRADLWHKSGRKQAYLVGFLQALPDDLPEPEPPRQRGAEAAARIEALAARDDPWARLLQRVASGPGQTWLKTVAAVLAKPPSQDIVTSTFDCLRDYFAPLRPEGDPYLPMDALIAEATRFARSGQGPGEVGEGLDQWPQLLEEIAAIRVLSGLGYGVIRPVLPDPTALGTLMRRKLAPVLDPIQERIRTLRGGRH